MRIFGDFATNFDADDRATAAGHSDQGGHRYAYRAGLGIGQLKKKHDWQIEGWWQYQNQFALDPNLIDSDIFNSQLNLQGVVAEPGTCCLMPWSSTSPIRTAGVSMMHLAQVAKPPTSLSIRRININYSKRI